jgi:hypothetical protein
LTRRTPVLLPPQIYDPYFRPNTTLWNATDFIAAFIQFIPPWGVRSIHYYGLYSSRCEARWERLPRVAPVGCEDAHAAPPPVGDAHSARQTVPQRASRSAWAKLIAKVYEVDPLVRPRCASETRLIAVIRDPAEVGKILRQLIKTGRAPPDLDPNSLL